MRFRIPRISQDPLEFEVNPGQIVYILGSNGAGKSALLLELLTQSKDHSTRWLSARRQVHLSEISGSTGIINVSHVEYRQDNQQRQNIFENQLMVVTKSLNPRTE